eukprot:399642-Hanusia_phi.AAC.1
MAVRTETWLKPLIIGSSRKAHRRSRERLRRPRAESSRVENKLEALERYAQELGHIVLGAGRRDQELSNIGNKLIP